MCLGCQVGDSETEEFWTEFLRDLRGRGLGGVQLVISDAHAGLVAAVGTVLQGAAWQRCRVHFMRNVLTKVPKVDGEMVATWIRTIFTMGTPKAVRAQLDHVAETLQASHPRVAEMLRDAKADLTAFSDFPLAHWRKIWSTNPLERLNKEVKRRTDVVGIFPNTDALLRLSACVLIEAHDEWQDTDRRYLSESSMALLYPTEPTTLITTVTTVEEVPELATA